jgi:hypothetical protein
MQFIVPQKPNGSAARKRGGTNFAPLFVRISTGLVDHCHGRNGCPCI